MKNSARRRGINAAMRGLFFPRSGGAATHIQDGDHGFTSYVQEWCCEALPDFLHDLCLVNGVAQRGVSNGLFA
ncbi:hypothetical protein I8744_27450 [Escherichia coli]|nr:hypothetical protein [Escherichia coli]